MRTVYQTTISQRCTFLDGGTIGSPSSGGWGGRLVQVDRRVEERLGCVKVERGVCLRQGSESQGRLGITLAWRAGVALWMDDAGRSG